MFFVLWHFSRLNFNVPVCIGRLDFKVRVLMLIKLVVKEEPYERLMIRLETSTRVEVIVVVTLWNLSKY